MGKHDIWGGVRKVLGGIAPLAGAAIGGPAGGLVGSLLSQALDVPAEPEAIEQALVGAPPEKIAEVKKAMLEHKTELARIAAKREENELANETQRIEAVNVTMRAEAQAGAKHKVSAIAASLWRPFWGVVSAVAFGVQVWYIMHLVSKVVNLVNSGNIDQIPAVLTAVSTIVTTLLPLWAVPGAILGVSAWHRGQMQRVQAGEQKGPGLLSAIASRIGKKN